MPRNKPSPPGKYAEGLAEVWVLMIIAAGIIVMLGLKGTAAIIMAFAVFIIFACAATSRTKK